MKASRLLITQFNMNKETNVSKIVNEARAAHQNYVSSFGTKGICRGAAPCFWSWGCATG